jgi:hypothetical protein
VSFPNLSASALESSKLACLPLGSSGSSSDEPLLGGGEGRLRYETDWWSPAPLSRLGVPLVVKLRDWLGRLEEVRLGRRGAEEEPPWEAARRAARPGPGVRGTADEGGESTGEAKPEGLEA